MEKTILGNRYELLEKIEEGGMSTIYKAYCRILNRLVAVKILKPEFSRDEEFLIKFNNEAKAAASLNHPNIISVFDVGQDGDIAYIVMEYVNGVNLKKRIKTNGPVSEKEALNILKQICLALKEAHKHHIIHRDIKPHNIMINENNVVKVGDFGIAKASTSATITSVGGVVGSVHYFSPEQARGAYMDERSDIYSTGVLLYELLTGKPPYDGDTPINVALKHLNETIELPDKFKLILTPPLQKMLLKMTQRSMERRYGNVDEVLADIQAIQEGRAQIRYSEEEEKFQTKVIQMNLGKIQEEEKKQTAGPRRRKKRKKPLFLTLLLLGIVFLSLLVFLLAKGNIFDSLTKKNTVLIPDILGKTVLEAEKELEKNNLSLKIMSEKEDPEKEEGTILSQNPPANLKIRKGEEISVVIVKKAEDTTIIPLLVGKTLKEAETLITEAKLQPSVEYEFSEQVKEGEVISQYPLADEKAKKQDVVKIMVSKGKEIPSTEVPSFIGKTLEEAKESAGVFKLGNPSYKEDPSQKDGVILYQNPEAGSRQNEGTKIDVVVNKLPKVIETPEPQPLPEKIYKKVTLVLPERQSMALSVIDKNDGSVVYSNTISTIGNENIDVRVAGYEGESKQYDIYIDEAFYATTGVVNF